MAQSTLGPVGYINPPPVTTSYENPAVHPFNRFFGGVPLSPELHPYDAYDETTWTLPEALMGKSKFLGQTFELLALMQNNFLLTVILPLVKTDEIQSHWSRWEFPAFIPDMVPHLGVVRFVKSNRISGKSTMARYGIGIFLEHGFMNSPEGILHYVMNIRQVLAAVLEGMQLEALQTLINVGNNEIALARKIHPSNTTALAKTMNNVIARELFAWGCLQQNSNAWALMDKKITQIVTECYQNRSPFTHYITSTKVDSFIRQIPYDQVTASIYGPDAQRKIRDGVQDFRQDEFGNKIFSARPFIVDDTPIDPFERRAQIGEYHRCFNHIKEQMDNYMSSSRTQLIFDEGADALAPVTLRDKVEHCHRFDIDGNLLHIRDARKRGDYNEKDAEDFLHYRDENQTLQLVRYMFQLDPKDFDVNDYQDFVTTFFNALQRRYGRKMSDYERALTELRDILDILGTYSYDGAMDAWLQLLARKNTGTASNNGANKSLSSSAGSVKNNIWGSLDIPLRAEIGVNGLGDGVPNLTAVTSSGWILPPTHGTYGGFKTISSMVRDGSFNNTIFPRLYGSKVDESLVIFEELADAINTMLPGAVTTSANFVNSSIHRADHRHALFENLVSMKHNPRYLFLHMADPTPANWALGPVAAGVDPLANPAIPARVERGTATADYTGRRVEESMFPRIVQSRNAVMSNIIGNLEAIADQVDVDGNPVSGSTFIGETIGYPDRAGGVPLRFSTIQKPASLVREGNTTKFVINRFGGLAVNAVPPFNAVAGTATLSAARVNADFNNVVYDTIARWVFLPSPGPAADVASFTERVNFYTLHTLIVFAIAMAKVEGDISTTYRNVAAVIDAIQEVVGKNLHDTADPSAGRYDEILVAMQDASKLPRLIQRLIQLYNDTRGVVFNTHMTQGKLEQIKSELEAHKDQIIRVANTDRNYTSLNPVPVPNHDAGTRGYTAHRNANISLYKQAPICLGRQAMLDYPSFAYEGAGIRRAIPASFKNPSLFMSDVELNIARTLQNTNIDEKVMLGYIAEVGSVFAPDLLRGIVDSDINMLPLVNNATARLLSPEDIQAAERQRVQNIRREASVTGTRSSMGLQALIGGAEAPTNKRRRVGLSADASTAVALPSIPAPQTTIFEKELTGRMKGMYRSLVRTYSSQPASMAIAVSYGFTPFTKQLLESTIKNNLDHPVDYLVVRPHATYTTVGVIKMIPGLETGHMAFGNIIAEVGDDAAIQTHLVTETHYQGAVIKNPKNIIVLNDVLVTGYEGGLGVEPIHIDGYQPSVGKFGRNKAESVMYFMISRHDVMSSNAFSLVGKAVWVDRQGNAESVDRADGFGYGTSDYYNAVWGFRDQQYNSPNYNNGQESKYLNQVVTPNAVVFKSMAAFENPVTKEYVRRSGNTGHFNSHTVGAGMHRARIGETSFKNIPINPLEQRCDISW